MQLRAQPVSCPKGKGLVFIHSDSPDEPYLIAAKAVTYDFARLMECAKQVPCSEFGEAIVKHT